MSVQVLFTLLQKPRLKAVSLKVDNLCSSGVQLGFTMVKRSLEEASPAVVEEQRETDRDPDKWIKQLTDEQRKTEIELVEGPELELSIQ